MSTVADGDFHFFWYALTKPHAFAKEYFDARMISVRIEPRGAIHPIPSVLAGANISMPVIKRIVRKLFSAFDFEITHKSRERVSAENFRNLVSVYEHQLIESGAGNIQTGNPLRPRLLGRLKGTPPSQAFEIIKMLSETAYIRGDVCEFGVAQGETSALIANEIRGSDKTLHLFDSFKGLPAPTEKDQLKDDVFSLGGMDAYQGKMSCPVDMVKSRLAMIGYPQAKYRIHQGFIEDLINEKRGFPKSISFAYVDFDFYEPIKIALKFLGSKLSESGIIMVDDYDYFSTGAKTATDEFITYMNRDRQNYNLEVADKRLGHFACIKKL